MKIQLAKAVQLERVKFPCQAELKLDGVRLIAVNRNGVVKLLTRNGKQVILPVLQEQLSISREKNWVLDGEICLIGRKQKDRPKISGLINSAIHGGKVGEKNTLYSVFDCIGLSDWVNHLCNGTYFTRRDKIATVLQGITYEGVHRVQTKTISSAEEAIATYNNAIAEGYEGLVLKPANHLYTFKRSSDWVKMKEVKTADLTCSGFTQGKGKYEGMVGSLFCEGSVEGKEVQVNVAGLSQIRAKAMFDEICEPGKTVIGQTIEVLYNSVTKDKTSGKYSLFLPRFVQVRFDK